MIAIVALLALAWLVYDGLCRLLGNRELLLAAALVAFVAASAYTVSELFSARALPIQLGAMLGTMMVGNVLFVIIPGHWELVHASARVASQTRCTGSRASSAPCTTTT